jgi:hypothetical protein
VAAQVLQWTRDWGRAQALAWQLAVLYAEEFGQLSEPQAGVPEWLTALSRARVPCALVSTFDRCARYLFHYMPEQASTEEGIEGGTCLPCLT